MSPELRHLRSFVVLAEELSFSNAARRLHVTQQSRSRTIQQLERELGTTLFARTTRSVQLTPAGREMLASATRATAADDEAFALGRRVARGEPALPLRVDLSSGGLETGVEEERQGVASGVQNTALQIGGGIGLALVSAVVTAAAGERPGAGELADALRLGAGAGAALPLIGAAVTWIGLAPRRPGRPRKSRAEDRGHVDRGHGRAGRAGYDRVADRYEQLERPEREWPRMRCSSGCWTRCPRVRACSTSAVGTACPRRCGSHSTIGRRASTYRPRRSSGRGATSPARGSSAATCRPSR